MKKLLMAFCSFAIIAFVSAGCSNGEAKNPSGEGSIKIVAAHNQTSPENPYQIGMEAFKETAESAGAGIEVEVHAGTLGTSESELVEKLKLGGADIVLVSPGFMSKTGIEEIDLFAVPYVFKNYDHWEKVVDGSIGKEMADIINEKSKNDFKLLGYWSAGVRHYYGKKPLKTIEDIKGMKYRTQTSGAVADYWEQVGAVPTSVAWGELYQGMQQGVVDAAENSYPYFVQQNHHKVDNGKYITETAHDYTTRFLLINGNKFDNYSEEQKKAVLEAAEASVKAEREAVNAQEEEYKEQAVKDGAEVNEIDRQPFMDAAEPIQKETADKVGAQDILKQIKELE
ncbi:TRAP transporter substrate-binding protein [Halobacillus sp. BAB-2008]|uniref:TRAP transporter substrate-binding protein n=1 Tax=Halobacillus sp. BAB-2008 TaxID=1246484 RepID=UPI0002A4FC69|nr:TRAP transporter substrate-binding protein [Halobacillus sp. BAB-2008]ELK44702.1 C4-dicarboxylate transport system C4-dicarboxylate-binding protein [Halobacillus sp. BAB-2008]